jgi:hypothetical protein
MAKMNWHKVREDKLAAEARYSGDEAKNKKGRPRWATKQLREIRGRVVPGMQPCLVPWCQTFVKRSDIHCSYHAKRS